MFFGEEKYFGVDIFLLEWPVAALSTSIVNIYLKLIFSQPEINGICALLLQRFCNCGAIKDKLFLVLFFFFFH